MSADAPQLIDHFFSCFDSAQRPHLLLDWDGTLAAFRVNRFLSKPWARVREILTAIQADGHSRIAIITGRPAHEIAPMLGLAKPLEVWGLHGAERLYPDGRRELEQFPAEAAAVLESLRQQLHKDALGGLFEDKPNAAVMHWRGYSKIQATEIRRRSLELFEPLASTPGLKLLNFDSGVELRAGRNKGGAIEAILAETDLGGAVAYLGDDLADEPAFEAIARRSGNSLALLVSHEARPTAATLRIHPAGDVRDFLKRWQAALG